MREAAVGHQGELRRLLGRVKQLAIVVVADGIGGDAHFELVSRGIVGEAVAATGGCDARALLADVEGATANLRACQPEVLIPIVSVAPLFPPGSRPY